jgi:UPF0042 nucleotide-binding protein
MTDKNSLVFVTGLSGAGMSASLKILEDLGYEVFDNFPLFLIDDLIRSNNPSAKPIALGIDTRTRGFDPQAVIQKAKISGAQLLFVTCDENVLQKRFTETRRLHPLAADRPVSAGIKKELALLYPLRDIADPLIDTTELSIHDLKRVLTSTFGERKTGRLNVSILSFGFKNGLPREADIVMDVRFLQNPHWDADLRPMTGQDKPVQQFIAKDKALDEFLTNFKNLLTPLFDRYVNEGKNYLTIAIGCTGGKHRSVYVSELMSEWVQQKGIAVTLDHRDIFRY